MGKGWTRPYVRLQESPPPLSRTTQVCLQVHPSCPLLINQPDHDATEGPLDKIGKALHTANKPINAPKRAPMGMTLLHAVLSPVNRRVLAIFLAQQRQPP